MDDAGGDDGGRWLTYDELADARGIDRQSARRMASRSHWRRQKDNRGVVRVYVPAAQAVRPRRHRDMPADISAVSPADMSADTSADATGLAAYVAAYREAMDGQLAALRGQIAALQAVIDRDAVEAIAARGQLAAALGEAEEAREQAQAAQRDAEASAAASLAAGAERDRLRVDLDTMREVVRQAHDAADALRQAEAARKARGLLARLRAAVRWG